MGADLDLYIFLPMAIFQRKTKVNAIIKQEKFEKITSSIVRTQLSALVGVLVKDKAKQSVPMKVLIKALLRVHQGYC